MTIRSFFRSLNVFATIADQRRRIDILNGSLASMRTVKDNWMTSYFELDAINDDTLDKLAKAQKRLAAHSQAVEAFMVERADFKEAELAADAYIAALVQEGDRKDAMIEAVNKAAMDTLVLAQGIIDNLRARVTFLEADGSAQAEETLEVVSYVKQCEAALKYIGITIEETDEGRPAITINGAAFVPAMEESVQISGDVRMVIPTIG